MLCVFVHVACCIMLRFFFFQAEDGIRDLVRSRGLGDVYKRQAHLRGEVHAVSARSFVIVPAGLQLCDDACGQLGTCLLYTSDAADERSSVDLGGRRIIKKKTMTEQYDTITHIKN